MNDESSKQAAIAFGFALMTWQLDACICGRFDAYGFIGALPAVVIAWVAMVRNQAVNWRCRIGVGFVAVVSTILFLKVVMDVLWTGHDAWFEEPQWVEAWIYWRERWW